MKQFFTVAVPTYNSALYIRQCLNGILSQTFRDFRLLILDDCSTDQTAEIIKSFLPEFEKKGIPAKLIHHNPNIGGYANFNRCIDLAEGNYLFIHHADDVMKPEMLEIIHERISALGDFSFVHVNSNVISKTGETEDRPYFQWTKKDRIFAEQNGHPFLKLFLTRYPWAVAQTVYNIKFMQADSIRFVNYPDKHDSAQDFIFFVDLIKKADRILHIQKPLMYRRIAETQWSKKSKKNIDEYFLSMTNETLTQIAKKVIPLQPQCRFNAKRLVQRFFYNKILVFYKRNLQKRLEILKQYQNSPFCRIKHPYIINIYLEFEWKIQLYGRRIKRLVKKIISLPRKIFNRIRKLFRKLAQRIFLIYLKAAKPEYGLNRKSRKIPVVVSLASHRPRFSTLHLSLKSLLRQSMNPDKIILNIAKEDENFIPQNVADLCTYGITIRICEENLKPHNKYFYTMQEYPEALVITVDDDIVYNKRLIERLYRSYQKYPSIVNAARMHKIRKDENGRLLPYKEWNLNYTDEYPDATTPDFNFFATGCGGTLYPPHCMDETDLFDAEKIKRLCLNADDIWLKFMQIKKGTKCVYAVPVKNKDSFGFFLPQQRNNGLLFDNVGQCRNDIFLKTMEDEFAINLADYC